MYTNPKTRVLVVDDDNDLRFLLKRFFEKNDFIYFDLPNTDNILNKINYFKPDLLILDIMLPGIDGIETLKKIRNIKCEIPVILLSAKNEPIDKIIGLESGADDYLGKPFISHELLARVKAVLRRQQKSDILYSPTVTIGDFCIDLNNKSLMKSGNLIRLSNMEYCILEVLSLSVNNIVSRNQLIERAYGIMSDVSERTIDVLIWRIRQIIEPRPSQPQYLTTVRGLGYMLHGEINDASF